MATTIRVRPLQWNERPSTIPYVAGVQSYGGGCEHWHRPHFPCGNSAGYLVDDTEKLCASHAMQRVRLLMFQRVPIQVEVAA